MAKIVNAKFLEYSVIKVAKKQILDLDEEVIKRILPTYYNLLIFADNECIYEIDLKCTLQIKRLTKKIAKTLEDNFNLNKERILGLSIECDSNGNINDDLNTALKELLLQN